MRIFIISHEKSVCNKKSRLQKATLMIKKARILRVSVLMEDCIHCLGEAISLINETYGEKRSHVILPCHQLAEAYCLRALCTQEVKSNSKQLFEDINAALNIWLCIISPDQCFADDTCSVEVEYMMLLLYNAIDLLSSKGFLGFHQEIYSLMIRVFKRKKISLEKFVAIFWESRRTSHGLCLSPVNEAFMMSLSQHHGDHPECINYWTHCLRESRAMLGRLQQNFFIFCENSTLPFCSNENNENFFQLDMTVDEVKEAASELTSSLPASDHSIFLAGSLYYSLCERHISNGRLLEALCYAKDAFLLHNELFEKKFKDKVEQNNEKNNEAANVLQVYGSSLHEIWSFNNNSWDFEDYLSPWNILQSYLESVLQVGIVYEIIGNSVAAERFLLVGENISCIQGLPLFVASFSSILGTCLGNQDKVHETHEIFLKGLSALTSKTLYDNANNSLQPASLLQLISKEIREDVFAIERAKLLYITSWFSLKNRPTDATGFICCPLFELQVAKLVTWLKLAFILCREVPTILHKVSRFLAIIHVASSLSDRFSLPSHNTLSESHWASFFHQASLGIHHNYQFHSNITERCKGFYTSSSTCIEEQTCSLLRTASESIFDLEEFIMKFFEGLPCTTTICATSLGQNYSSLLQDLLIFPSCVRASVLLSRFNSKNQPLVIVLSVDALLQEKVDMRIGFDTLFEGKDWQCPWPVVDDVVPEFKMILKENYVSSEPPLDDSNRNRELWWRRKENLDDRLQKLLRTIEDSWLGPWRIMFLGDWQPGSTLDSVCHKLVRELKLKANIDVNESLLKVILGGSKDDVKVETFMSELWSKKGCYAGRGECCDEERKFGALHRASSAIRKRSALAIELIGEAISQLEGNTGNREPIILVLDDEVQMLPWENLPVMRNQEVYCMPSVGSISMMFDRSKHQTQHNRISFPMIDLLDAFYLLNPDGDLSDTQDEFENWFKDQHWEGKAGSTLTAEELAVFLQSHDLFIYCGHGCGKQYIPRREIQKLKNCAASLLMGCSSGSLKLNGSYAPEGTPLSYLQAGSPFIVANLWEVGDTDIDRFSKAMLDAWLRERSNVSAVVCSQCELVSKELESRKSGSKYAKKKDLKKKLSEKYKAYDGNCNHRPKIGSFMSQARETCRLRFLNGASPVCYGVPTGIWKKKGKQYISKRKIQKLKNCAASLLMGCSSGSLKLNGSYAPEGTPLSYLLQAGSPFIVANLWEVGDKDIDRFSKAMLDAWLRERSNVSACVCSQCELVSKELESVKSGSKYAKKRDLKKKLLEKCEAYDGNCNHRPKIGSFMSQAREACTLRFLIGASPVCYGVPTAIWSKKGNDHIKR